MEYRTRFRLWPFALLAHVMCAAPAGASAVSAINQARNSACLARADARAMIETPSMDAAAAQLARGRGLHDVLAGLPSRPAFAAATRLSGATSDYAIARAAAARFCADLATPGLEQIGVARTGDAIWVIVAQPNASTGPEFQHRAAAEILRAVNEARSRGRRCGAVLYAAAPPVQLWSELSEVARAHAERMAAEDALEHEERDGTNAAARVHLANLPARHVGENIASGVPTASEVAAGWLASPDHCSVIMDPRFTTMGVAYALRSQSHGGVYWTQLFVEPAR